MLLLPLLFVVVVVVVVAAAAVVFAADAVVVAAAAAAAHSYFVYCNVKCPWSVEVGQLCRHSTGQKRRENNGW